MDTRVAAGFLADAYWEISALRFHSWGNMRQYEPSPDHDFSASPDDETAPAQPQELLRTVSVIARSSMNERIGYYLRSLATLYEVHATNAPNGPRFRWPRHAIYPLARSVVENASLITWLSDPAIDVRQRVERTARFFRYSDFWETKFNDDASGLSTTQRHADIINALAEKTVQYKVTEPVLCLLGEDGMRTYNRWSAVGHGTRIAASTDSTKSPPQNPSDTACTKDERQMSRVQRAHRHPNTTIDTAGRHLRFGLVCSCDVEERQYLFEVIELFGE